MVVLVNAIKPQGLEPLQFPTKFRSPSINRFSLLLAVPPLRDLLTFQYRIVATAR